MNIRVYYKDTDMGGIVYHSNYLDFCEMARSEMFFQEGKSPAIGECHFAIKKIEADFMAPSYLGDMLEISTKVLKIKHTSLDLYHEIWRDDTLIFKQKVTLVFLCKDGKPHRIDEATKEFFARFTE
jgi:acyl-CoA thioester hydrolase